MINSQSFPKSHRLSDSDIFTNLISTKPKLRTECLNIHILPNNLEYPRLGMIIAKKFCKKANKRNKLKRIIREAFRTNKHTFGNSDILVRLKININHFTNLDYQNQANLIQKLFNTY